MNSGLIASMVKSNILIQNIWFIGFPCGSVVKNPPAVYETWVWCLGQKNPLEEVMANLFSILAARIQWTEELGRLESIASQRVGHYWGESTLHAPSQLEELSSQENISQLVQSLSCVWFFVTPWIAARQASLSITNCWSLFKLMSIELVMPSSHLILCRLLLLLAPIPPSIRVFSNESVSLHEVAKVLESQLQHQSFQWTHRTDLLWDGLAGSPCSPRDSQESSTTPQFKSINFLVLSFLHSPTLTSIHDHWKNHSLD